MRAGLLVLGIAALALPAPGRAGSGSGSDAAAAPGGLAAVSARIEAERSARGLPGAGLAVWRDGALLHRAFFGAYDADTVVPIASATKWISAAVVLSAVDAGELDLDAPLSHYLADLPPRLGRASVRRLLSMTAGVPRRGLAGMGRRYASLEAFAAAFARERRLVAEPGEDFRYGGDGFQLAGRVAEVATGRPFRALFRERIAEPCGMDHTRYAAGEGDAPDADMPLLYGGARSTLDDYVRFLAMLISDGRCGGTQVLSAAALREMHRNQTGTLVLQEAGAERLERQSRYGLGSWLDEARPDGRALQSSSPGSFGFTPWIHWEHELAGVLMQVAVDARRGMIPPFEIIEAVHGAVDAQD